MNAQLRLCPFCGSNVERYQQTSKVPDNWVVRCEVCGAQCGPSASSTAAQYNWNTRVAALAAPKEAGAESALWVLRQILADLPESRDWMDPAVEKVARELVARNPYAELANPPDDQRQEGECGTCNGHGMIGGFVSADSGYESDPCPDCASPPPEAAAPLLPAIEWLIAARNLAQRGFAHSPVASRINDALDVLHALASPTGVDEVAK